MDRTRSAGAMAIAQARPNKWLSPGSQSIRCARTVEGGVFHHGLNETSSVNRTSLRPDIACKRFRGYPC